MGGKVVHFEIPADDVERAKEFYRSSFGWEINTMPEMDYTIVQTAPSNDQGMPADPGAINGGMFQRSEDAPAAAHPTITIDVDDIDKALEIVSSNGGSTVAPKQPVAEMGFYAYFKDSEGNLMGLWETAR